MSKARAAAIYTRISSDPSGTELGVVRQEQDCRTLAEDLGWPVAEVYCDNDTSAWSGKRRPAFERMLADLAEGTRDAVICYHVDRLTRGPKDLVRFRDALDATTEARVRFVSGPPELAGDGKLLVGIMALVAENESEAKSRRIRRKNEERAQQGLPHVTSNRPFGYEQDGMRVIKSEAKVVRALVDRFLAGESLKSLATWLDDSGVKTVRGNTWKTHTIRGMLTNPRYAGVVKFRGEPFGKAQWPAIITEAQRERILRQFEARQSSGRRPPRRYLLSGMLRCGKCGSTLYSSARQTTRRYVCISGPDHGGCGRLTVVAGPVEEWLAAAVLHRLDTPALADALAGRSSGDERVAALAAELDEERARLVEVREAFKAKRIKLADWLDVQEDIERKIDRAQRALANATDTQALTGLVGNGAELGRQWASLNLVRQAAIIKTVLSHAVIKAGTNGARELDPARIQPHWVL